MCLHIDHIIQMVGINHTFLLLFANTQELQSKSNTSLGDIFVLSTTHSITT